MNITTTTPLGVTIAMLGKPEEYADIWAYNEIYKTLNFEQIASDLRLFCFAIAAERDAAVKELDAALARVRELEAINIPGPRCQNCGTEMGRQTEPNDGSWWCPNIKCGINFLAPQVIHKSQTIEILKKIILAAEQSGAGDFRHDTWNLDAHVELTLTISEIRAIDQIVKESVSSPAPDQPPKQEPKPTEQIYEDCPKCRAGGIGYVHYFRCDSIAHGYELGANISTVTSEDRVTCPICKEFIAKDKIDASHITQVWAREQANKEDARDSSPAPDQPPEEPKPVELKVFNALREANIARNVEWSKDDPSAFSLSFRGNELAGEVGEACNVLKKIERERLGFPGSRATIGDLAEELADVVICADLLAMDAGINLETAISEKFNKTSEKYGLSVRLNVADGSEVKQ